MKAIERDIEKAREALAQLDPAIHAVEMEDILENLESMLLNKYVDLEDYFSFVSNGSFKVVYWLDSNHDYVIKFATEDNATDKEMYYQKIAKKSGLDAIFLPQIHFSIDAPLYIEHSNYDSFVLESYEQDYVEITDIFIQKAIKTTCYDNGEFESISYDEKEYESDPLVVRGSKIEFNSFSQYSDLTNKTWLQQVGEFFGVRVLQKLLAFISDHGIADFNDNNLAYMTDGRPVIIDCM